MTLADELFFNGQIQPMRLSSHSPLTDLNSEDGERGRGLRVRSSKYSHRKARSISPLCFVRYEWQGLKSIAAGEENEAKENESSEMKPSCSASSSRSSSSGRNSKKWMFLKDLLHRSKSEGRTTNKEHF